MVHSWYGMVIDVNQALCLSFYNIYKCRIMCIPETNIMLYVNYITIKNFVQKYHKEQKYRFLYISNPGEGNSYPLQNSGLENSMDCIVHGVTKSQTQLSDFHFHFQIVRKYTRQLNCIHKYNFKMYEVTIIISSRRYIHH